MSYLRFSRAEYQILSSACSRLNLATTHRASFKFDLVEQLIDSAPPLAQKIAGFGRAKMRLLFEHYRQGPSLPGPRLGLADEDIRVIEEVYNRVRFAARFVRPLKSVLVTILEASRPEVARKLAGLSEHQFERLLERLRERTRRSA